MSKLHRISAGPNRTAGTIILLHGLDGDAFTTWGGQPGDPFFWPQWVADDLPNLAVYSVNYPAAASEWFGTAMPLSDRAKNILELLLSEPALRRAPVALVGHSLGGLVLKQVLREAHDRKDTSPSVAELLRQIAQVVFIATPHTGTDLPFWLDALPAALRPSVATKEIVANSPHLRELNVWYRRWADTAGVDHLVFYEMQKMSGVEVVNPGVADPGLARTSPIPVDADHSQICKPQNKAALFYKTILTFFRRLPNSARARVRDCQPTGIEVDASRMPTSGPHFLGREAELVALRAAWDDGKTNIFVLNAMGGIGKTALINRFLQDLRQRGWRGAERVFCWSFHSQGTDEKRCGDADEFFAEALAWFGYKGDLITNAHRRGLELARLINRRPSILVLDGLEPLQHPAHSPGLEGKLRDEGLVALFRQLAAKNKGLLIVTTRIPIPELKAEAAPNVERKELKQLDTRAAIALLRALNVRAPGPDIVAANDLMKGHALSLNLLGTYSAEVLDGHLPTKAEIERLMTSPEVAHEAYVMMRRYEILFEDRAKQGARGSTSSAAGRQLALLYLIGLFDRPADKDAIAVLLRDPIDGLTSMLGTLSTDQWAFAIAALRKLRLLLPASPTAPGEIDAHPLVREYFGHRLRQTNPSSFRIANSRLYEHYKLRALAPQWHSPDLYGLLVFESLYAGLEPLKRKELFAHGKVQAVVTCRHLTKKRRHELAEMIGTRALDDALRQFLPNAVTAMAPLFAAIKHGAAAGRHRDAYEEVYWPRIRRGRRNYACKSLGAYAADLSAVTHFYETPWSHPAKGLLAEQKAAVLGIAGNRLKSIGRLPEAIRPLEQALAQQIQLSDARGARSTATNLAETTLKMGDLAYAAKTSLEALRHAGSARAYDAMLTRATLGHVLHQQGLLGEAKKHFERVDGWVAKYISDSSVSHLFSVPNFRYCEVLLSLGHVQEVATRAAQSHRIALAGGDLLGQALSKLALGRASAEAARHDDAQPLFDAAVTGVREAGTIDELPGALLARAAYLRKVGNLDDSYQDVSEAEQTACLGQMKLWLADTFLERARLSLCTPTAGKVRALATQAEELIEATGYRRRLPELNLVCARISLRNGALIDAKLHLDRIALIVQSGWILYRAEYEELHRLLCDAGGSKITRLPTAATVTALAAATSERGSWIKRLFG